MLGKLRQRITALFSLIIVCCSLVPALSQSCPKSKFDCRNGRCIRGTLWCDGKDNCGNSADETSCKMCYGGSVKCTSVPQCVTPEARCNGVAECDDDSDEEGCVVAENNNTKISASGGTSLNIILSFSITGYFFLLKYCL